MESRGQGSLIVRKPTKPILSNYPKTFQRGGFLLSFNSLLLKLHTSQLLSTHTIQLTGNKFPPLTLSIIRYHPWFLSTDGVPTIDHLSSTERALEPAQNKFLSDGQGGRKKWKENSLMFRPQFGKRTWETFLMWFLTEPNPNPWWRWNAYWIKSLFCFFLAAWVCLKRTSSSTNQATLVYIKSDSPRFPDLIRRHVNHPNCLSVGIWSPNASFLLWERATSYYHLTS